MPPWEARVPSLYRRAARLAPPVPYGRLRFGGGVPDIRTPATIPHQPDNRSAWISTTETAAHTARRRSPDRRACVLLPPGDSPARLVFCPELSGRMAGRRGACSRRSTSATPASRPASSTALSCAPPSRWPPTSAAPPTSTPCCWTACCARSVIQRREVQGAAIASVVPPLTGIFEQVCTGLFRHDALVVGAGTRAGIRIATQQPRELGADRVVNAIAVQHLHGSPAIVVDFETATSFDVVAADGAYAARSSRRAWRWPLRRCSSTPRGSSASS